MQPFTLKERLLHVADAEKYLGGTIPWICDTMENDIKHALGDRPNSEYVIDPEGKVVRKRSWSDPKLLRKDLEELVGPVDNPTSPEEVQLKFKPPEKVAAEGVIPRLKRSGPAFPMKVIPQIDPEGEPFYVKLRVEAQPGIGKSGRGEVYFGFFLDPLYRVHWNNLVKPISVQFKVPEGISIEPAEWDGPKIEIASDIDPREFFAQVKGIEPGAEIEVHVQYFACNDDEGWCKGIKQQYVVRFEQDKDGGRFLRPKMVENDYPGMPPLRLEDSGRILEIDDGTREVVFETTSGDHQIYRFPKEVKITLNGKPALLSDLRFGDECQIKLNNGGLEVEFLEVTSK